MSPTCSTPFPGLSPYNEADAARFFGRESELRDIDSRLRTHGVVVLYGASGMGKTSLLRAGVLPNLRCQAEAAQQRLVPVMIDPGPAPLATLRRSLQQIAEVAGVRHALDAAVRWHRRVRRALPWEITGPVAIEPVIDVLSALSGPDRQAVLCVDPLDTALGSDGPEQRAFLDVLTYAARHVHDTGVPVLLSVGAHHLARLAAHEGMASLIEPYGLRLNGLSAAAMERVVEGALPTDAAPVEPGLVSVVLADADDGPGCLGWLNHTFERLWMSPAHGLTHAGYGALGRIEGVLREVAEACWPRVESPEIVDQLWSRLVSPREDGSFVPLNAPLVDLCEITGQSDADLRHILGPLIKDRLLRFNGVEPHQTPALTLTHTALLHAWPHLAQRLKLERPTLLLLRHLRTAAAAWSATGHPQTLWSRSPHRLARAQALQRHNRLLLTHREQAFLIASQTARTRRHLLTLSILVTLLLLAFLAARPWLHVHGAAGTTFSFSSQRSRPSFPGA